MTDRELLELAAKAAALSLIQGAGEPPENCMHILGEDGLRGWNPLRDDGDAFRLAVKLGILFSPEFSRLHSVESEECADPLAATRRAIVRAAAEIGRGMP